MQANSKRSPDLLTFTTEIVLRKSLKYFLCSVSKHHVLHDRLLVKGLFKRVLNTSLSYTYLKKRNRLMYK